MGSAEPRFNKLLLVKLGLADDPVFSNSYDPSRWPELHEHFKTLFASKTRDEWCALLEGTDACFAPVLTPEEAAVHPHMVAREVYSVVDGVLQANPAPRFSGTPLAKPGRIPRRGEEDAEAVLKDWSAAR
ncbi:hypothetical protein D3C80_1095180 [compost metagenome]